MKWHHCSEHPALRTVALLAINDARVTCSEDDPLMLLYGLYLFTADGWVDEEGGKPCPYREFWYCKEGDLLASLKAALVGKKAEEPVGFVTDSGYGAALTSNHGLDDGTPLYAAPKPGE